MRRIFFFVQDKKNDRTKLVRKNILGSLGGKLCSVIINLVLVPTSILFIDKTQYGIWLTLSSIVLWLNYFDVGLTHGFRNKFAEAKANNNINLAKKYVATTYATLSLIFFSILIITFLINQFLDWNVILNINDGNDHNINLTIYILIFFFCIRSILNAINGILAVDQKSYISGYIDAAGAFLSLIIICVCLLVGKKGNLPILAFLISGIPCFILGIFSIYAFNRNYKNYSPCIKNIDFRLNKNLMNLGIKIFIVQITNICLFQLSNLIIIRYVGADAVTQFNIANKYFGIANMIYAIIVTPFWSAFTEAYTLKDFIWMQHAYKRLTKLWNVIVVVLVFQLICSPFIYKLWIKDFIDIPFSLSFLMALYIAFLSRSNLYMNLLNGMSLIKYQMYVNLILVLFITPLMFFACKIVGINGVIGGMILTCIIQSFICHIQLKKNIQNS